MGRACDLSVQPAACQRESRFAQPISDVLRIASWRLRCADRSAVCAASWLPAGTSVFRLRAPAGKPVTRFCTAALSRQIFRKGIAIAGLSGPQEFPRPQARSSPPRCIGLSERTQHSLKGRVQAASGTWKVSGVRSLHMSSTCHNAANCRQSYGYRGVQWSSTWITMDLN